MIDEIPEPCDVCGDAVTAESRGQRTADAMLCLDCCRKFQAAEPEPACLCGSPRHPGAAWCPECEAGWPVG